MRSYLGELYTRQNHQLHIKTDKLTVSHLLWKEIFLKFKTIRNKIVQLTLYNFHIHLLAKTLSYKMENFRNTERLRSLA